MRCSPVFKGSTIVLVLFLTIMPPDKETILQSLHFAEPRDHSPK